MTQDSTPLTKMEELPRCELPGSGPRGTNRPSLPLGSDQASSLTPTPNFRANGEFQAAAQSAENCNSILKSQDVAGILGVSRATVMRWGSAKKIPGRKVGRDWFVSRSALLDWLSDPAANGQGSGSRPSRRPSEPNGRTAATPKRRRRGAREAQRQSELAYLRLLRERQTHA